jgi:hypothetical protein
MPYYIHILYYILAYIQHNGDVSLDNYKYYSQLHPEIRKPEKETVQL